MFDRLAHLNSVERDLNHPYRPPRNAASLIIVDLDQTPYKILMGSRHPKSAFVPSKFVFPGGAIEDCDLNLLSALHPHSKITEQLSFDVRDEQQAQTLDSDAIARALPMTAIRETFEETGLMIGTEESGADTLDKADQNPGLSEMASQTKMASQNPWQGFKEKYVIPDSRSFVFLARAITPLGRPRRFDTRFFVCPKSAIFKEVTPYTDELSNIGWYDFEEALDLAMIPITRVILEELNDHLIGPAPFQPIASVPFFEMKSETFCQQWINI